jgi:hypothetical protein
MNERMLGRLFRRVALGSIPLSVVATGVACGTSGSSNGTPEQGDGSQGDGGGPGEGVDATNAQSDATNAQPDASNPQPDASNPQPDASNPQPDAAAPMDATSDMAAPDAVGEDAGQGDGSVPPDPCAPFQNHPGCGGGQNFCVAPDASVAPLADGGAFGATCMPFCGGGAFGCSLVEVDAAQLVRCTILCTGRRPAGLGEADGSGSDLGAYLSEVAYLEAASVAAFRTLRRELRHHGAPRSLLRAAARAARDEVRHARAMASLARRHGGVPRKVRVKRTPLRTLTEMAIENAVEGCVRETFGALVATYQARAAADGDLRAAMQQIAKDETRHAALAWKIHEWADRRLEPSDRRQVDDARRVAIAQVASAVVQAPSPSVQRSAGIPGPAAAARMMADLRTTLWRS